MLWVLERTGSMRHSFEHPNMFELLKRKLHFLSFGNIKFKGRLTSQVIGVTSKVSVKKATVC